MNNHWRLSDLTIIRWVGSFWVRFWRAGMKKKTPQKRWNNCFWIVKYCSSQLHNLKIYLVLLSLRYRCFLYSKNGSYCPQYLATGFDKKWNRQRGWSRNGDQNNDWSLWQSQWGKWFLTKRMLCFRHKVYILASYLSDWHVIPFKI